MPGGRGQVLSALGPPWQASPLAGFGFLSAVFGFRAEYGPSPRCLQSMVGRFWVPGNIAGVGGTVRMVVGLRQGQQQPLPLALQGGCWGGAWLGPKGSSSAQAVLQGGPAQPVPSITSIRWKCSSDGFHRLLPPTATDSILIILSLHRLLIIGQVRCFYI